MSDMTLGTACYDLQGRVGELYFAGYALSVCKW